MNRKQAIEEKKIGKFEIKKKIENHHKIYDILVYDNDRQKCVRRFEKRLNLFNM